MGTRSEIRFTQEGKLKKCIYHHYDGYPSHIINDLSVVGPKPNIMKDIAKAHGTQDINCSFPKSMNKHQGDIEYSYVLDYSKEKKIRGFKPDPKVKNVKVFEHHTRMNKDGSYSYNKPKQKKLIFEGDMSDAVDKFLCK